MAFIVIRHFIKISWDLCVVSYRVKFKRDQIDDDLWACGLWCDKWIYASRKLSNRIDKLFLSFIDPTQTSAASQSRNQLEQTNRIVFAENEVRAEQIKPKLNFAFCCLALIAPFIVENNAGRSNRYRNIADNVRFDQKLSGRIFRLNEIS